MPESESRQESHFGVRTVTTGDGRTIPRFAYAPPGRRRWARPRFRIHTTEHVRVIGFSIGNFGWVMRLRKVAK